MIYKPDHISRLSKYKYKFKNKILIIKNILDFEIN